MLRAKHYWRELALAVLYFVSTWVFRSRFLYNWDAGQFALGTVRFSLREHQPHPPGYFLFLEGAKWLNHLTGDVNGSFLLLNAIAGGLATMFFFLAVKRLAKHEATPFLVTLLFVVQPVVWFHRVVALTYTFETLVVTSLAYLLLRGREEQKEGLPLAVFVVALLAGFRPSVVIIALPFFLALFVQSKNRLKAIAWSIGTGVFASLLWLPWFARAAGGWQALVLFIWGQLRVASGTQVYNLNHVRFFWQSVLYDAHVAFLCVLFGWRGMGRFIREKTLWVIPLAILWQVVFSLTVHFGEVGYSLSLIPLALFLVVPVIDGALNHERGFYRTFAALGFVGAILLEIALFLFGVPGVEHHKLKQLTYQDIRKHDARIEAYLEKVRRYKPDEVVILVLRGQYLDSTTRRAKPYPYDDIRLLSYYLPEYTLHDMVGVPGVHWVAEDFRYTQHNATTTVVSAGKQKVLLLGEYIHPEMWPKEISVVPRFTTPDSANWYEASFTTGSFHYNGLTVIKEAP